MSVLRRKLGFFATLGDELHENADAVERSGRPLEGFGVTVRPAGRGHVVPLGSASPLAGRSPGGACRAANSPRHRPSGTGEGQALVPALRLELVEPRVPVPDVPVGVDRHHVLVPCDGVHGIVDVAYVLGAVELVDPDDRLQLAVPDRIAARERDAFAGGLDRAVDRPADPFRGGAGGWCTARSTALDQREERVWGGRSAASSK